MKNNNLYDKAYAFSVQIVEIYNSITTKQKEFVLSKQLLRCSTSIGANIAEANPAISKSDFSAKISIAYKESLETKYWLSLLKDTKYIDSDSFVRLNKNADELSKILFSIIKTTRIGKEVANSVDVN